MPDCSAFFYGTLMAPSVLARVTGHEVKHLTFRAAILPGHRRHRVRDVDYPAVVPADHSSSPATTSSALPHSSPSAITPISKGQSAHSSVRGTWVSGLNQTDFWRLDLFEGSEYARCNVKVRLLAPKKDLFKENVYENDVSSLELSSLEEVQTQTYIWIAPLSLLDAAEWDFEEFKREKLWRWAGGIVHDEGFDDVEQAVRDACSSKSPVQETTRADTAATANASNENDHSDPTRGRSVVNGTFEEAIMHRPEAQKHND